VTCTDFLSQLTDYFDGHIDPDLLAEVQAHICEWPPLRGSPRHHAADDRDLSWHRDLRVLPELRDRLHTAIMSRCLPPR